MKPFELILRFPGGAPLIGGHASDAGGAHIGHATDHLGRPVVPSTAIRGALRATLEALCRGTGRPACTGGDGRTPTEAPALATDATAAVAGSTSDMATAEKSLPARARACTLDAGGRCLPCRLFGSQRDALDPDETAFSGLVLESAHLATDGAGWQLRPGVALSRTHRSAHDKALVFQRVPVGRDLHFVTCGRLRVPALATALEAAVRATLHIGAGRSRGLGQVAMELRWLEPATAPVDAPAPTATPDVPVEDVYVHVELQTPAALGVAVVERNFLDARLEIPGSTMRGAVGFALAELVPAVGDDPAFRALVAEVPDETPDRASDGESNNAIAAASGAHFGFLYPVDEAEASVDASGPDTHPIIGPLPITAQACKRERRAHGIRDTLIDRLALALADTVERAERAARAEAATTSQCSDCGSPMRSIAGSRRAATSPRTRAVTRVALDRARGSARDEQLFTQMRIEPGAHFEGTIRNVPAVARARLAQALRSGLLSVGRGRAAGWGKLAITATASVNAGGEGPLRARGAAFERALRERLQRCGMDPARADRLVPVTLLAPLVPTREDDPDGAGLLVEALGGGACTLRLRRFTREGGWDQQRGVMRMCWAVTAGSVFVLELPEGTRWRDVVPRLEALERGGVGARRHQGFGQVLCFDPFFLGRSDAAAPAVRRHAPSSREPQESSYMNDDTQAPADLAQRLRPHRKALVEAAESVMSTIAASLVRKGRAGKTQLHRLAAVCNQAACVEEITNYLRYQAGRESGGESFWDTASVDVVIQGMETPLRVFSGDDERVAAWRLYAVFLMRAFTYRDACNKNTNRNTQRRPR